MDQNEAMMMGGYSLLLIGIALVLFGGILGCFELGYQWARRTAKIGDPKTQGGTEVMDAAVFALLGLLLAFQFAGAANRLQTRREISLAESNAISTAYSRLDLLEEEPQSQIQQLFRDYVDARIRSREAMPDVEAARKELAQAQSIFNQIWAASVAECQRNSTAPGVTQVVIPALNEVSDLSVVSARTSMTHSPALLQIFTFVVALICATLAGIHASAKPTRPWLHLFLFTTVITFTFYVILDLEYPRVGFIQLANFDEAFTELRQSMR